MIWRCRISYAFPVLAIVASSWLVPTSVASQSAFPGGFIEKATDAKVRPRLTKAEIQAFLPTRGKFTFPSPYNTEGIRITNGSDCAGQDCVYDVGYSYWRQTNNHVSSDTMLIFLGLRPDRGGSGPTLFSFNKVTGEVKKLGPLFDASSRFSWYTGEGWYFSAALPTTLYIHDSIRLYRFDVGAKSLTTVFDVSSQEAIEQGLGNNRMIWQTHSSNDDRVHSATLRTSGNEDLGCIVYNENTRLFSYYPKRGTFDECQIDKSGRWLLIKENVDNTAGEDNRIIDLQTGKEAILLDQGGAGGHSDNGYGYFVAADNWNSFPNAIRVWIFGQDPLVGPVVFRNTSWKTGVPQHISHANAKPGTFPSQQYACGSGAARINDPQANEIICFRLDTSLDTLVVAPVMTDLDAPGGGSDYAKLPKGNLDVTGQYFIWTSNIASDRLDAFIVKVPAQLLNINVSPDPPPAPPKNVRIQ